MGSLIIYQTTNITVWSQILVSIIKPKLLGEVAVEIRGREIASMPGTVVAKFVSPARVKVILSQSPIKLGAHRARVPIERFSLSFAPHYLNPFHRLRILLGFKGLTGLALLEVNFLSEGGIFLGSFLIKTHHVFVKIRLFNVLLIRQLFATQGLHVFGFVLALEGLLIFLHSRLNVIRHAHIAIAFSLLLGCVQNAEESNQIFQRVAESIVDERHLSSHFLCFFHCEGRGDFGYAGSIELLVGIGGGHDNKL